MDRTALQTVALAVLCIVAVALAAGALSSPVAVESGDGEGDGGGVEGLFDSDDDSESGSLFSFGERGESGEFAIPGPDWLCYPAVAQIDFLGLLLLGYLAIGAGVTRLSNLGAGTVTVVALITLTIIIVPLLLIGCESPEPGFSSSLSAEDTSVFPDGGEDDADGESQPVSVPSIVLIVLLVVTLVGLLAALYIGQTGEEDDPPQEPADEPADGPAKLATVAGQTADDIEKQAAVENAVYRAWAEMTAELSVADPETMTPGQFARAAIDAGMDPDDVDELTSLFEEVRYGNAPVTEQREQEAIETLRRIEQAYGGDSE